MEAYDLARKLAYAGARSPIPFTTGAEFTNSVPGVPVLSMLRIFVEPDNWTEDNVKTIAREIARVLGATEQFDVGITRTSNPYDADSPAAGVTARLMKLDARDPHLILRLRDGTVDHIYKARFPKLRFEPAGEDSWGSTFTRDAADAPSQP
jgi:hypothetical protein